MPITFNKATATDIQAHLLGCEAAFVQALSQQIDIGVYAQKLADMASRFEIWQAQQLVGLLAVYCNQPPQAFISNVSLWPSLQGQGHAAQLMQAGLAHVQSLGLDSIALKVAQTNSKAMHFYQRLGFETQLVHAQELTMRLSLKRVNVGQE